MEVDHRDGEARLLEDLVIAAELELANVSQERLAATRRPDEAGVRVAPFLGESRRGLDDVVKPGARDLIGHVGKRLRRAGEVKRALRRRQGASDHVHVDSGDEASHDLGMANEPRL